MTDLTVFLFFFHFEIHNICQVVIFFRSTRKFVFAISSSIEFLLFLVFKVILKLFSVLKLGMFFTVNVLWQFGYAKFYTWCECKLAIIRPCAFQIPSDLSFVD